MSKIKKRLPLLDFLRGIALISMMAFHFSYDINEVFGTNFTWHANLGVQFWQQSTLSLFIWVSGMACMLTIPRKMWWRGLQLNVLGLVITAITTIFMPSEQIIFGVLNFFGCAMWVTAVVRWIGSKFTVFNSQIAFVLLVLCFLARYASNNIQQGILDFWGVGVLVLPSFLYTNWLVPLGFTGQGFVSADYVPLLPHIFMFWCGALFMYLVKKELPQLLYMGDCKVVNFCGRHSLLIYLLHQPIFLFLLNISCTFL